MSRVSGNYAMDKLILGSETRFWQHRFIKKDGQPCCDLDKKIIYSPAFGSFLNNKEDALVRAFNFHEAGHGRYTPCNFKKEWSSLKRNIYNSMEDLRIEKALSTLSPILADDLRKGRNIVVEESIKTMNASKEKSDPLNEALFYLHSREFNYEIPIELSPMAKKYIDAVSEEYKKWKDIPFYDEKRGFYELEPIVDRVCELLQEERQNEKNKEDGEPGEQDDDNEQNDSSEQIGNSEQDSDGNPEEETSKKGQLSDKVSKRKKLTKEEIKEINKEIDKIVGVPAFEKIRNKMLKEISERTLEKSGDYVSDKTGDKFVVAKENISVYNAMRSKISCVIGQLTRYIEESLKSRARCTMFTGLERGNIDRGRMHVLAKSLSKNVFYKVRDGIDFDVAVSLLVDESGSMIGANMYQQVATLAITLSETLSKINIKHEILGHTTTVDFKEIAPGLTRDIPILMKVYKDFSEVYQKVKHRLGSIKAEKQNVDGEALWYTGKRLMERVEKRKIIFVLSDGAPCSGQCNSDALNLNLIRTCDVLRKNGVEVYAFGLGTTAPESFYGNENFLYLDNIRNIGPRFFKQIHSVLVKNAR